MVNDEGTARQRSYLDRLAHSEHLDSWPADELTAALAMLTTIDRNRRQPEGEARVVDIRLRIYQQRLRRELAERALHRQDRPET